MNNPLSPLKYYYKAIIQYDGSGYAGFQWQKEAPTIQSEINSSLQLLFGTKVTTVGASRTDSGVHAMEQIIKITSEKKIDSHFNLEKFNQLLPRQIRCLNLASTQGDFKPASNSRSKEYRYFFTNHKRPTKNQRFISNVSYSLDFNLIHRCLKLIIGTHHFHNFCSSGSNVKSTLREITHCELKEINPHFLFEGREIFPILPDLTKCYQLQVEGNGFLKHMIRHIVSSIWMVGSGRLSIDDFSKLLNGPKINKRLWRAAPADGLFLFKINQNSFNPKEFEIF